MIVDVDARVLSNTRLSSDYNVLALAAPEIAADVRPGQFVMVRPGSGGQPFLRRPFSVFEILRAADGTTTGLSLLNKQVGLATRRLFSLVAGDSLPCLGPLGRPFTPVAPPAEAWMIAGGVGLAPFATLAEALHAVRTPTTLFYGARRSSDLFHVTFFERLGVRLVLATEDGSRGHAGVITLPLEDALRRASATSELVLYVCGPTGMMAAVASLAARYRVRADVSLEQVMGCGLGGCYSCVVSVRRDGGRPHFVRSCLDGPVFASDEVVWDTLVH